MTFVFHQICSQQYDPANYSTCMADYGPIDFPVLNQFLDWLQNNPPPNTTIETVGQVMHPGTPPPAPVITDQPAAVTGSTIGTFSFTDAQAGVNYQCMVDGIGSQCSSPFTSGALADGSHTFTVKARDAAGNVSDGTSYTWTTDTTLASAAGLHRHAPEQAGHDRVRERVASVDLRQHRRSVHEPADRKRRAVHELLRR